VESRFVILHASPILDYRGPAGAQVDPGRISAKEGRQLLEVLAKAGFVQQAVPQLTVAREGSYMTVGARVEIDGQPVERWLQWDANARLLRLLRSVRDNVAGKQAGVVVDLLVNALQDQSDPIPPTQSASSPAEARQLASDGDLPLLRKADRLVI